MYPSVLSVSSPAYLWPGLWGGQEPILFYYRHGRGAHMGTPVSHIEHYGVPVSLTHSERAGSQTVNDTRFRPRSEECQTLDEDNWSEKDSLSRKHTRREPAGP